LSAADFAATLTAIENDKNGTSLWDDSVYEDAAAAHEKLTSYEFGWKSIAIFEDGKRTIHPDRMGRAGQNAFGIDADN
jgi:hypothetical protein